MFHPQTNEPALEWIELHNQNAVDVDLAGWRLSGGLDFTFPIGTVIRGGGYLVVAISPQGLAARGVTNVFGPFLGRLSNNGDQLRLRDLNNRLMDELDYGVDGDWPVAPDGGGPSLSKLSPNLASKPSRSWAASKQAGGTPGRLNFSTAPLLGAITNVTPISATWRYNDSGIDPGVEWRTTGFSDSAWPTGFALFYVEDGALPAPRNTPLAPDRNTYLFRGSFQINGNPADRIVTFRHVIDDGAVIYVNGTEVSRFNMPTGAISFSTMASAAVGNATYAGPFAIPSSALVLGQNSIAVEVHQTTAFSSTGVRVVAANTYSAAWDGTDGDYFSTVSPAYAPTNAALSVNGVEVFTTSNTNSAANLNDGRYGNGSAWSPAGTDAAPNVVLRFNQAVPVSSIAWSRDNGNSSDAGCAGGACTDRSLGNYTIQYTLNANPAAISGNSSNPSNGWTTIATAQYLSAQLDFTPHLRHRFVVSGSNGPVLATGIRIRATSSNTFDEIEINTPALAVFDAVFGLELDEQAILPPPPELVFNEVGAANPTNFWLEVINAGSSPAELGGVSIVSSATGAYTFPSQLLAPGAVVAVLQAQLGFGSAIGERLFLYSADGSIVLDAVTVRTNARGRLPDGSGRWSYPSQGTPGSSNIFLINSSIVFNELMFHPPPRDPVPAITTNVTALLLTNSWRYHDAGADLGSGWRAPAYDDSGWSVGAALMQVNAAALPGPVQTTLTPGRNTYYFRTAFNYSGAVSNLSLMLRSVIDDGAVFYLNGTEIYRYNMPGGTILFSTSASSSIGTAASAGPVMLPPSYLVQGINVLAVEVHQATAITAASGIVMSGGGLALAEEGPSIGTVPMNLARQVGAAPFVIDSLAGYPIHDYLHLNDGVYGNPNSWIGNSGSPGYAGIRFAGLSTISSIAFGRDNLGTFSDRTLGTYSLQFTRVMLPGTGTTVTGNPDTGWATIGTLNYQSAGTGLFSSPSRRHRFTFTPVDATGIRLLVPATGLGSGTCIDEIEVNPPETSGDIAFGTELVLATTLSPALPFRKGSEEWLEFFNRGDAPVDLTGWRLDNGIDFRFTNGPVVEPGGYVVVANNAAALKNKWPEVAASVVGNFSGNLGEGEEITLRDPAGNVVTAIEGVGGVWSDGGGSSLELIDPRADLASSASWADSDETARSSWQTYSWRMIAGQRFGNVLWNEIRLGMLDAGETLVDDVSVVRDPDGTREQLIQNGDFEIISGNTHWRMLGNHGASAIVTEPDNLSNHVLKVSASGPSRTSHNHIESSFAGNIPLIDGVEYEVSFRARWQAGSPQLGIAAYHQKLAKTILLSVPERNGTPGAQNTRRIANSGPTLTGLRHSPVIPAANQPVTITVQASDPDSVAGVTLHYRVNPASSFSNVPMAAQADGWWSAQLPGQPAARIIQFYTAAIDDLGASAFAPAKGPASRALYQVADSQGANLPAHELRLIQLDTDRDFLLNSTNVMSQERLGGTAIYNRSEVFYDVAVRLHGSAAGRARDGEDYISYDIEFPPNQRFRGAQRNVGIDRSGRAPVIRQQHEIFILHMFQRAALPTHYSDLCYFIAPKPGHSGTAILQLGAYNSAFVEEQYNTDGSIFNLDLTYEPSTTVNGNFEAPKLPVPLQAHVGTDIADLGDDVEQYRAPFDIRFGERADDYSGIMRLCKTMSLPQGQFEAEITAALNVNEALRVTALTILCGLGDIYFSATPSLPHNCRIFTPEDGPAEFLPWDMDFVFTQGISSSIYPTSTINISKLLNNAGFRRLYLWHINDLCDSVFNPTYMSPWLSHYGSVVGQNYTGNSAYIQSRRSYALSQLPAAVPFAIDTNGGQGFGVNTNFTTLSGSGWLDVRDIEVNGIPYNVAWNSVSNWSVTIPLMSGTNFLTVQGVTRAGERPASLSDFISITNAQPVTLLPVVINEWMADNIGPGGFVDHADGLFQDWLELFNPNETPVNLSGYFLTDDFTRPTKFRIPTNTTISARGFLMVWADENGSQNTTSNAHVHANFKLSNSGESIGLFAPDGLTPLHAVSFGPQIQNVSQGLFPDGAMASRFFMTNWTPASPNLLGVVPPPSAVSYTVHAGALDLSFSGTEGRTYRVLYKDNLSDTLWNPTTILSTSTSGLVRFMIPIGPATNRFFRLRLE